MLIRDFNGPDRAWQVTAIERELLLLRARSGSSIFFKAAVEFNLGSDSQEHPASLRTDNLTASQGYS